MNLWLKISVVLILIMIFGSGVSYLIASDGGSIAIQSVTFYGASGNLIDADLFIPPTATAATPAPAVLVIHGYNNFKDIMTNTAMELARRGYVVLNVDMSGHGYSSGAVGSYDYGAPDSLNYLYTVPSVNTSEIGLVGMSMGGWAITDAALSTVNTTKVYSSMFFMDSYPIFTPTSDYTELKNVAIQMSYADEFPQLFLGVSSGSQDPNSVAMKELFNTTAPVVIGQLYGNIAAGTARIFYQPDIDHAASTESTASITNCVTWMELTIPTKTTLANSNMIFPYKQFVLSLSFAAAILFMFAFGTYLLDLNYFKDLKGPVPQYKGFKGIGYVVGAIIGTALGPLLYLWAVGTWSTTPILSSLALPLSFPNDYATWFSAVAAAAIIILGLSWLLSMRKAGVNRFDLGFGWSKIKIMKSFLFAVAVLTPIYITLWYCYALFKMPFTLSGLPIPFILVPLNLTRAYYMPTYFLAFLPIFIVYGIMFAGFLRPKSGNISLVKEMIINSLILSVGSILLLLSYYIPLYATSAAPWALLHWPYYIGILGIDMIYFIPIPLFTIIAACILTWFFRKTGKIWPGVLLITLFITWYLVAFSAFGIAVSPP